MGAWWDCSASLCQIHNPAINRRGNSRLSLASKSELYERAKRRMAHPFKKQTRKGGAPSVVKLRVFHPPVPAVFHDVAFLGKCRVNAYTAYIAAGNQESHATSHVRCLKSD